GAPIWAGLIAVANQQREHNLGAKQSLDGALGTLPALYGLASNPTTYSVDFHDIVTGANHINSAGLGYDLVTGLGTPNARYLVPDLASYIVATQMVVTQQPPPSITA